MRTSTVGFKYLLILLLLILTSCLSPPFDISPSGTHEKLGTRRFQLQDPRGLVVQAWYPASGEGTNRLDPIIEKNQAEAYVRFLPVIEKSFEERLQSNSYVDAPLNLSGAPYPVIIFDHGYGAFEKQNVSQMEELASNGYIVFSINHPGESYVTLYPDGSMGGVDSDRYPSMTADNRKERKKREELTREFFQVFQAAENDEELIASMRMFSEFDYMTPLEHPISERTRDILNFMDALVEMNDSGFFKTGLDLVNIGMYGHSMGGNVSNNVGGIGEWPVSLKAVANLDGPQLLFSGQPLIIPQVPFLMAYSEAAYTGGEILDLSGCNDWILNMSAEETWRVVFKDSAHANFSDLTYVKILEGNTTGDIDGREMGIALERLLLAWFDRHLKGKEIDLVKLKNSYSGWELSFKE
ncbi:MAG: hypothetical protein RQ801_07710 [Spirochaetaceae bacterium]|nr:hypothetical protein [Spirochaetaceae bacterium]MDT8298167.1 hypothetical protein [Spirochaetaceae bacterium]